MTNMKNKSVSERTSRRRRYIDAIDPLRQRYKCSAKEVASLVIADLNKMENRLAAEQKKFLDLLDKNRVLVLEKEEIQTQLNFLQGNNDTMFRVNLAMSERLERQDREIEILKKGQPSA